MAPLPPSPPSSAIPGSLQRSSSGSEWSAVARRNIKSSLLLLLVLSAVFAFSILNSSSGLTVGTTTSTGEALRQSPLHDVSRRVPEHVEDQWDEPTTAPADNNGAPDQSTSADISLPSSPAAAAPNTAREENVGPGVQQLEEKCDISRGKWLRDPSGPVYTNVTCPMLPDFKNCQKFGKDPGHLYWRWQPDGCELPRFVPERFLDVVRGKRLAFIGDSLARNQMDSLLCLLSQAETPREVHTDAFDRFGTWYFPAHDFTLTVMWTEYYTHAVPVAGADGKPTSSFDIHLDRLGADWTSRLPGLDYAVISGGNWFFRVNYLWEGGRRIGCINCGRDANLTDFGVPYALRRVVRAAVEGIAQCRDCKSSLVTFLRTYSPDHFEHGSWFSGGSCTRKAPLEEAEVSMGSIGWELRRVQSEEVRRVRRRSKKRFGVLDVTKAMMMRADGHPGAHFDSRWNRNGSDCLHWCLPGPVDMWNGVLLQRLAEISRPPTAR
ncbi:unnamed protein product [Alopecurus aequalis]